MKIVFIDPTCPYPYDNQVLLSRGLGGTEATVVRIASALALKHDIHVCQHNRREMRRESTTLTFRSMQDAHEVVKDADHVVFVQKAQDIGTLAPAVRGRTWLWLHNYIGEEIQFHWKDHVRHRLGIICVSATHAESTRRYLRRLPWNRATLGYVGRAGVVYHHNPIDDGPEPSAEPVRDRNKLVFFSSPHKGVEQVLARFREAYAQRPSLRLFVADPGYLKMREPESLDHPGIVQLGSIPQSEVLRHVREALCVFYPQYKRAETFGLVYAESNAVGTPVLAHDFGSAREVLSPLNPPIDATRPEAVLALLFDWIDRGGPAVGPDKRFSRSRVAAGWMDFFEDPERYMRRQRAEISESSTSR